jgi:hypothetical protein
MVTIFFGVVLMLLGFLCFTGPGGINGPTARH